MKIANIQIDHMNHPVGFELNKPKVSFSLLNTREDSLKKQIIVKENANVVYNSGLIEYTNNFFKLPIKLLPRKKYNVEVSVKGKESATSSAYFETGKLNEPWTAKWISNENKDIQNTLFKKDFESSGKIDSARLYISALGLYEAYLNGDKVGKEFLTPGCTAYDKWVQIQTYDVTEMIQKENQIIVSTGDGWFKGNMGLNGGQENIYGNCQMTIAELHIIYNDGHEVTVNTDDTWKTTSGKITKSAIYYGEDYDSTIKVENWKQVKVSDKETSVLTDRLSLPVKVQEELEPVELIKTPKKENVVDFGQNHTGFLKFYNREPKGTKLIFQFGETLQKGNFYRDNLRYARAAFTYVSDGKEGWVRQHFTFYGFRYVKVEGNTRPLSKKDFKAPVLYSDMNSTGDIETDNHLVNRLFKNIQWGQKSNFIDIPTDCPQRDERMGWTGDANIFFNTASLNMNVYEFFKKYMKDMAIEQESHNGMLTMYAPKMGSDDGGVAAWGDAATFIPWKMYQAYGDIDLLNKSFGSMKSWVDWITQDTKTNNLWTGHFQFGDWVALDGENSALPIGKTDSDYIASVYYFASTTIVARAAKILGKYEIAEEYKEKSHDILQAIRDEYITKNGRIAIDTQTAYALALYFNLVSESQKTKVVEDLVNRLHKDNNHLQTGFIGTPLVNQVLSQNGHHNLAMKIFMQEDFPSWLYAVKMGATTVWERWNSIQEDGSMNPDGMNSLNHYSIGAIMEWVYRYVLGIRTGTRDYQQIEFSPLFDYRMKHVKGHYESTYGDFKVEYQIESDNKHTISLNLNIPYGVTVKVNLPRTNEILVNGKSMNNGTKLTCGEYEIKYIPDHDYIERYKVDTKIKTIMNDKRLVCDINKVSQFLKVFDNKEVINGPAGTFSLKEISDLPSSPLSKEELSKINSVLLNTVIKSERLDDLENE